MRISGCIGLLFLLIHGGLLYAQEYFQQEVNYNIEVELDDVMHRLSAFEKIEYINNSPDSLQFIFFHLWPNAYKEKNTALGLQKLRTRSRDFYDAKPEKRGYIEGLDFKIDGLGIKWDYDPKYCDICKLWLNNKLPPGGKIEISTPFQVKIPSSDFSRLGHNEQSYQITQWYPKPAVYDNNGWHQMPYLDMGEFYSEFGSYDVFITVPANYVIGATGNLHNEDEIAWLDSISKATLARNYFDPLDNQFPVSDKNKKRLHYSESKIHDFAWFADKRYNVLKGVVKLPHSGETVTTWTMFTNLEASLWKNSLEYINDAVYYYSLWMGDYPYNNCTAVEGALSAGGGMEYPTITIIGSSGSAMSLEEVIMHEVGHNWFYGILGSNERDHPWLDEGINSFYELRYMARKYPNIKMGGGFVPNGALKFLNLDSYPYQTQYELAYHFNARRSLDQPIEYQSDEYSTLNYAGIVYMKTAFVINFLKSYLGDEEFDRIMQIYFEEWKFKHPQPYDFIAVFNENCKKDLSWFLEDIINSTEVIDYKISKLKRNKKSNTWQITFKNKGSIQSPFTVSAIKNGQAVTNQWIEGFAGKKVIEIPACDAEKIKIDAAFTMPDIQKQNNSIRTKGVLKQLKPIRLKFLGGYENPDINEIYWLPVAGWNYYNKFMIGALFYNSCVPQKKIEYVLMPMYSTGTSSFAGYGKLGYNLFLHKGIIRNVLFSVSGSRYAADHAETTNYHRYKAEAVISLKKDHHQNFLEKSVVLNVISAPINFDYTRHNVLYNAILQITNWRLLNPYNLSYCIQGNEDFAKTWLDADYKFNYNMPRKGIKIRLFAGAFLYSSADYYGDFRFRLSGWGGSSDYQYENTFLGRTEQINQNPENILSHQFVKRDGGFSVYTGYGQTDKWMTSLNATADFPGKIPLKLYFNLATYDEAWRDPELVDFPWEGGIELSIIPEIFSVYFPLLMSADIKENSDFVTDNYFQKVRFTLNLSRLDVFMLSKNMTM